MPAEPPDGVRREMSDLLVAWQRPWNADGSTIQTSPRLRSAAATPSAGSIRLDGHCGDLSGGRRPDGRDSPDPAMGRGCNASHKSGVGPGRGSTLVVTQKIVRITSGKVVAGTVVVEGDPLPEGATVTILTQEDSEEFELTRAEEEDLLEAIRQADDNETGTARHVLSTLNKQR